MKIILKIIAIILFFLNSVYAQQPCHTYTIDGTINIDTGIIMLRPVSRDSSYYPFKSHLEGKVINGKFMFTDSIDCPVAYRLFCLHKKDTDNAYASSIFLICPGLQTIVCNMDSSREIPKINNSCMEEYKEKFIKKYGERHKVAANTLVPLDGKFDNQSLLQYTKENPNSYLALWWLISSLYRQDTVYQSIYNQFSDSLKSTITGKTLSKNLKKLSAIAIGDMFPQLNVVDNNDKHVVIPENKKNKYTLIDFWYTHCTPCMVQIPKLKKLYDQYKQNGFGMIGVSIDDVKYLDHWKDVIKTRDWNWPQYWDKDAKNATGLLSIEGYPYNFLLDQNGVIVKKNIPPEELEMILKKMPE